MSNKKNRSCCLRYVSAVVVWGVPCKACIACVGRCLARTRSASARLDEAQLELWMWEFW